MPKKSKIKKQKKPKAKRVIKKKPAEAKSTVKDKVKTSFKVLPASRKDFSMPKMKLVGIGGAGGNALTRIQGIVRGLETIALNTDAQDLQNTKASKKIQIGRQITRGRGSGMNPEIGQKAVEESKEQIAKALEGAELVFITCGLGGGTGSGGSPIVAEIAQSLGIVTIGVVTLPFSFEGKERQEVAQASHLLLKERVDALVTVPNDRIFNIIDVNTSLKKAFWEIDEILREGIQAIYDLIMKPGLINVDFADLKTIIKNSGESLLGIGVASGKDRAEKAAAQAIQSPLLDITIDDAKGVLFNISARGSLNMVEVQQAAKTITNSISENARVIFGANFDHRLPKNKLKIVVVATGFNRFQEASTLPFDRESAESTAEEETSLLTRDVLKEKIEPFESLEEEPAFLRRLKKS
ncbi:MAG: cell division protein FtsZ [Patescibacteria group bacterium]